ncbi:MAG TPA: class I SAM-dependent methyltransferase [Ktedonobacterales bacterium]
MQERLIKTHQDWEDLAQLDAVWAVNTHPEYRFGQGDMTAFFRKGEVQIAAMMAHTERLGYPARRETALDFGCGVGRLTRALAGRFQECVGVDIAETMIEKARALNSAYPNCTFVVNEREDLTAFPDAYFDLIYTREVLQHQASPDAVKRYIAEFLRVLRDDGILVFQLPRRLSLRRTLQPRRRLYSVLRTVGIPKVVLYNRLNLNPMKTISLSEAQTQDYIASIGGRVLYSEREDGSNYDSTTYYVVRDLTSAAPRARLS